LHFAACKTIDLGLTRQVNGGAGESSWRRHAKVTVTVIITTYRVGSVNRTGLRPVPSGMRCRVNGQWPNELASSCTHTHHPATIRHAAEDGGIWFGSEDVVDRRFFGFGGGSV
jgi:hypothetical protein